jgi:hypothetical protein
MSDTNNMLELSTQIMRPIIYYFPEKAFAQIEKKYLKELNEVGFTNTLMLQKVNGDISLLETKMEQIELLKKEKILKSNILRLIEFKAKHNKTTFDYQLEDYLKDVETWVATTDFTRKTAKDKTNNYFEEIQPYLEMQHAHLKAHLKELKKRFKPIKVPKFSSRTFDVENVKRKASENAKTSKKVETSAENTKDLLKSRKTKIPKPTVEDVDKHLLKTVFNKVQYCW